MKTNSTKSKPIQNWITSIGAYHLRLRSTLLVRSINTVPPTFALLSTFAMSLIITVAIIIIFANSFASAAVIGIRTKEGTPVKDTEALTEIQAPAWQALRNMSQPIDIIGLFAKAGAKNEFLAVSSSGKVSLWTLNSGQENILFPAGEPILACAYDVHRNILAVTQDSGVSLFDLNLKQRLAKSPNLATKSSVLEFSPDGNSLLVGGEDGKVYRWRINIEESGDRSKKIDVERYIGHASAVTALAYHPYSRMFLSADSFGTVAAWLTYDKDLFGGKYDERSQQTTYYSEDGPRALSTVADATTVLSLRISNDGQNVFAALQDGRVQWSLVRGLKLVILAQTNKGAIYDMQISPSGKFLATVARDGMVRVWKTVSLDRAGIAPGGKEIVPDLNNFTKDSIGYLSLVKEFSLEAARKLLFLSDSTLVVGENSGRLLELSL